MKETEILLKLGQVQLSAVFNDSTPAKQLISMLPYTVKLNKYAHDYCGLMTALPYKQKELRCGWANGDIAFAADGNYLAIFYKDEEISQQFGNMITLGRLMADPSIMDTLDNAITVEIQLK